MITYRCYLLDIDGKIRGVELIEYLTDGAALEMAELKRATCGFPSIEIWDKARRVGIVGHRRPLPDAGAKPRSERRLQR